MSMHGVILFVGIGWQFVVLVFLQWGIGSAFFIVDYGYNLSGFMFVLLVLLMQVGSASCWCSLSMWFCWCGLLVHFVGAVDCCRLLV